MSFGKANIEVSRMKRWKWWTGWVFVWVFLILVGGIMYTGYLGTLYSSSPERTPRMAKETNEVVSALTAEDPKDRGTALILQTETGDLTEYGQASVFNNAKNDQEISKELTLKDFPTPVHGSLLRNVGNYYSEAFDNYLFHAGVDYAEPEGTVIRATQGGKVIFSGADPILGQKVILDCGEGWQVTYGGLANLRVQIGETVETQDALGQVGLFIASESENAQTQLHYEVWHGDEVQYSL